MHNTTSELRELIESGLSDYLPQSALEGSDRLNEAIRYAMFPGGKRLRPVLTLLGVQVVGGCLKRALPVACAVEFLHTTSLVFDDLPAMDDASLRRGHPALHLVFGEGVAQLAALALLNETYALFGRTPALIAEAAACLGTDGMIGGQAVDLEIRSTSRLTRIPFTARNRKTSALLRLTLAAGALACDAAPADVAALAQAGECLGEAYQICDDLLDEFLDGEDTGKDSRQDARHQRPSHAAQYGASACHAHVLALVTEAKQCLTRRFGSSPAVSVMLAHIDEIVREFSRAGLAVACT